MQIASVCAFLRAAYAKLEMLHPLCLSHLMQHSIALNGCCIDCAAFAACCSSKELTMLEHVCKNSVTNNGFHCAILSPWDNQARTQIFNSQAVVIELHCSKIDCLASFHNCVIMTS